MQFSVSLQKHKKQKQILKIYYIKLKDFIAKKKLSVEKT